MATKEEFLRQMWPHALAAAQATGLDPRIVMAQAAVESNWGNAAPNNNYFGQKDFSGSGASLPTEEVIDGKRVKVNQPFAKYDSPEQSFGAYAQNINTHPAYARLRQTSGYGPQVAELGKSGYATDPRYASVIDQTARDLTVPTDVQPSVLSQAVNGPGPGGSGGASVVPPDPRNVYTAPDAPADVTGQNPANPMPARTLIPGRTMQAINAQANGLLAAGAPTQIAPQRVVPMLQVNRPRAQLNAAPIIPGLRGLLG